jgi:integrase
MATRKQKGKNPLWLHPSGQWCKKHKGQFYYFGTDADAAAKRFREEWDAILEGRPPKPKAGDVTLATVVNAFLNHKRAGVESGELHPRTFAEYYSTGEKLIAFFGRERVVADIRPDEFARLRAGVASKVGLVSVLNFITKVRVLFKFALDNGDIETAVKFGKSFDRPEKKVLDKAKKKRPKKELPPAALWKLIDGADVQMKAMILLAINSGMGSTDCANLTRSDLAARPGWLDYPRVKTGVDRRFPLWPETREAIAAVSEKRPEPKDPADADLVFLTRYGFPWARFHGDGKGKRSVVDSVSQMFGKLGTKTGVTLPSGFYILRHIFRTKADETLDRPAIDCVMGHSDPSMGANYRQSIADERLEKVVNHVRDWLMKGKGPTDKGLKEPAR